MSDEKIDITDVMDALSKAQAENRRYDDEYSAYDGYEWGYVGHDARKRRDDANEAAGAMFDRYIDQRIDARIAGIQL